MTAHRRRRGLTALGLSGIPGVAMAAAPHLGGGGDVDVSLWRVVIAFVICAIVAVLAILLIRQRGGRIDLTRLIVPFEPRARMIDVVETRRLNPQNDLCLVRCRGHEYLLLLQHDASQVLRERVLGEDPDR